jgi:hypothetical protein
MNDPFKLSFDRNIGKNSDKKSSSSSMLSEKSERQNENTIFLTTSLLNSKINTLSALASIHATNVQRQASGSLMSEGQIERMEKNEAKIDRLNDEIDELDRTIRSHFSNSASGSNPNLLLNDECKDNMDGKSVADDDNISLVFKTPNVGIGTSRIISIDTNATSAFDTTSDTISDTNSGTKSINNIEAAFNNADFDALAQNLSHIV